MLQSPSATPERNAVVGSLRQQVPEPVLAHYLRRIEQGDKGVAEVRNGVCSCCHMRVPSSVLGALLKPHDLLLCETCGAYLYLPQEESNRLLPPKPAAKPVRRRGTTGKVPAEAA